MKRTILLLLIFICCFSTTIYSQVGIGTTNPNASSALDIQSTDSGILIPRVSLSSTLVQAPVTNPAESLLVYNTNTAGDVTPGFYYWTGSAWKALVSSGGGGGGDTSVKAYGEKYYTSDETIQLTKYNNVYPSTGVVNSVTTSNITTTAEGLTPTIAGVYRVTLTITYSKEAVDSNVNEIEFFIAKNGNNVQLATIRVELDDDLKRRTITINKLLSLESYQAYVFGISKVGEIPEGSTGPKVIIHKDMTNMTIERID